MRNKLSKWSGHVGCSKQVSLGCLERTGIAGSPVRHDLQLGLPACLFVGPIFFFSSMHNLHFWIISFPHLTSRESRKCTGTPHSIPLPPVIHRPFIENHSIVQTTKFSKTAVQCFKCRCCHAAEARLEFLKYLLAGYKTQVMQVKPFQTAQAKYLL